MKIVDGKNKILGRLATQVAKMALQNEKIAIVNCEKVVVVGKKKEIFDRWRQKFVRGTSSMGPFIHRSPDRLVRRAIRGMLPYKTPAGSAAFKNIMCYLGEPENLTGEKVESLGKDINDTNNLNFATMEEISKQMGAKQ